MTAPGISRSLGDPVHDPFWARIHEAGVTVAFHSGDAGYKRINEMWGGNREFKAFEPDPLQTCLSAAPISDTLASVVVHGVLDRHPKVRLATIECGSDWVAPLLKKMKVLTSADRDALAAYSQTYARWRKAEEFLEKHGDVYPLRDEHGQVRCMQQFPQVSISRNLLHLLKTYQQEFGLTPSARSRIQVTDDSEGMGVAALPCYWADQDPSLRRIYPDPYAPNGLGFWVLIHPDMRRTARVRAFVDFITRVLKEYQPRFEGRLQG